jgi:hypothetical protein
MILDIFYKGHIQVVFVYKAPACKLEHFKEVFLYDVLRNLNIQQSNILIIGDFNFSEQNMNENFVMLHIQALHLFVHKQQVHVEVLLIDQNIVVDHF